MWLSTSRFSERLASIVCIGALLATGLYTGIDRWLITIDWLALQVDFFAGSLSAGLFTLVIGITGLLILRGVWLDNGSEQVTDGPSMLAIVPAYRDAGVLPVSVESLLSSAYASVEIAIVVEPDDPKTNAVARSLAADHQSVSCLVNGEPGSKATAINHAVRQSDAGYFAVFDADVCVSEEFIPVAMGELLDGADVFQGRRVPRPTGPVETLAYCERIIVQGGYAFGDLFGFTHCQSSSTAFTRGAFDATGGYEDTLTEDIQFSHKCHRAGLAVSANRRVANTMEAPHTLRDLWGQRKRWRIGHVQVFHGQFKEAFSGGIGVADILSIGRATGGFVGGAFLLVIAAHILILFAMDVESAFVVPYLLVVGMIAGVWTRDALDGRVGLLSWTVMLVPLIYFGHGALSVKAAFEYYLTWDGEWYTVTKTGI